VKRHHVKLQPHTIQVLSGELNAGDIDRYNIELNFVPSQDIVVYPVEGMPFFDAWINDFDTSGSRLTLASEHFSANSSIRHYRMASVPYV